MTTRRTPPTFVRLARLAGLNAALILGGLALLALAGEAWLRLTAQSGNDGWPRAFVPGVGVLFEPHAEVLFTNDLDFWTTQRANSLGFLDREPPDPERAAASCHVAVIGDSFVEAIEVPIADKLHVRLEALAAAELPELDVTASAWGRRGTGQANQLPYYDEYARPLRPNLLVLVFVHNDFADNSPVLQAMWQGWDPDRTPYAFPVRGEDGSLRLRPPDPGYAENALPWFPPEHDNRYLWFEDRTSRSLFLRWLGAKRRALAGDDGQGSLAERAGLLAARPGYEWILDGWEPPRKPVSGPLLLNYLTAENPRPLFAEALEFTAWALAEFRSRADRDGAAIVVLSVHDNHRYPMDAVLRGMTEPLGIPVIGQRDWIVRSGGRNAQAQWPHDRHWSPQGHRWAAEAIFDWLRRHPETCED